MGQKAWDTKSTTYQKFDGNLDDFRQRVFDCIERAGLKFDDKKVIDIGCGTGLYTLFVAKFAKEVLAVDFSQNMLLELEKSAQHFGICNVKTKLSSFENLSLKEKFDIAILTMSPAVQDENLARKFINLASAKIYLNWQKPRFSSMLEPLFEKFGRADKPRFSMSNFLVQNGVDFKKFELNERRISRRNLAQALENATWHLEINGANFTQDELKIELEKMAKNGFVDDEIVVLSELLIFGV